jgi:hypothetical protein
MITLTKQITNRIKNYQNKGVPSHKRGRPPFMIPQGVQIDWNKTNHDIAEELDTTPMTILLLRRRLGIPSLPKGRPHKKAKITNHQLKAMLDTLYEQLSKTFQVA